MKKDVYMIGVFPPPFGGVTVKNKLFLNVLQRDKRVDVINIYEAKSKHILYFKLIYRCILAFISKSPIVFGLDSKRLKYIMRIESFFPNAMSQTTILVVGGVFPQIVEKDRFLKKAIFKVKDIWVETNMMKIEMNKKGYYNVKCFPNPRSEVGSCAPRCTSSSIPLKIVFFSKICKEKGVEDIIEVVRRLNNKGILFQMYFYGHIAKEFQEQFDNFIQEFENVFYCGIFDGTNSSVYKKLNEFDILLFPTHCITEGIPGILVEAKMAGLAVIASDQSFNAEIIREEEGEGYLLRGDYVSDMTEIIERFDLDRELLFKIKQASYKSRKRYAIEAYTKMISCI